jgi:putative hemolysin
MSAPDPWLAAFLLALLLVSAAFSASETALFRLDPAQRARSSRVVRQLLSYPRDLLVTILLGNLVANVLFFAFAARLRPVEGRGGQLLVGLGAILAIVVFAEILPKTIGLRASEPIARFGAPPLLLLARLLRPVRRAAAWALEGIYRMLGPLAREEAGITSEGLAQVLDLSAERGELLDTEADIAAEILELSDVRVREIMTPRVDVLLLLLDGSNRREAVAGALGKRLTWLPVADGTPDRIVGRVKLRDVLGHPEHSLKRLVMPVVFVPEVASALDALRTLQERRAAEAIVVDEWGGTAGLVTLEDVFEEIVGELRIEGEERRMAAVPLGEGKHRVDGSLSIREWNDHFGYGVVPTEFETVGGFVTALLGRIPRTGDVARHGNLVMEVREVRGRRVRAVDMHVAPERAAGAGGAR